MEDWLMSNKLLRYLTSKQTIHQLQVRPSILLKDAAADDIYLIVY